MEFLQTYLTLGLAILILMTLLWLASLALKNASIVDAFWGPGFVITTWLAFLLTPVGFPARKLLIGVLVTIWGLRLALHILVRNWGKPEDFRYQAWRAAAGHAWRWRSYFKVFLLRGALMWLIGTPLLAAQVGAAPDRLTTVDYLALTVWLVGFCFEAAGDWQLTRFKAQPENRGKLLNTGVWRYTRHPNYFGDAAQWWGCYLVALSAGAWWTIFAPILMTGLLLRVSGVTLLEKNLKESKPGYRQYMETTSEFLPWLARSPKE